jgi:hypothetical protein
MSQATLSAPPCPAPSARGSAKPKPPTKAQLQEQLAAALARAETAEAALRASPAAPPAGAVAPESLLAPAVGVMRVWLMTESEGYRLRLVHIGPDGCGWSLTKWSDGTTYHLFQADGDEITCDCPGAQAHGPRCNAGKGCKHARMLRALRQLVDPGI